MKRPFDLVSFLEQERRVSLLDGIKDSLSETSNLDSVAERHDPDFESKFYSNDEDCNKAGQPLTEFDLFVSTLIQPDPLEVKEVNDILKDEFENVRVYEQPLCSIAKPQHFELDVIDDLSVSISVNDSNPRFRKPEMVQKPVFDIIALTSG